MTIRRHSIVLYSPQGVYQADVPFARLAYTLAERQPGSLELTIPPDARLPLGLFVRDSILLVTRRTVAGPGVAMPWLVRRRRLQRAADGTVRIVINARHPNDLLARRIVAYASGSSEASKSDYADDLIKAVIRENFTSPTDTVRTMAALSVAADLAAAPSVAKAFAWQNVLSVAQNICQMAAQDGTYLGFEVRFNGTIGAYLFVTYTGQRGVDRRAGTAQAIVLGPTSGVGAYSIESDWEDEATTVYAGGQGEGAARDLASATNSTAAARSPVGRAERFRQATMVAQGDTAALADEADAALYAAQARIRFDGQAQDSPGAIYGLDYDWGDLVTVLVEGLSFGCRIDPVRITEDDRGEDRDIRLTSELVL